MDNIAYLQTKIEALQDKYNKGKLVPVLGAGLSRPFGLPNWGDLLIEVAKQFRLSDNIILTIKDYNADFDYLGAIKVIVDRSKKTERDVQYAVANILKRKKVEILQKYNVGSWDQFPENNNYADIAALGCSTILTSNYDEIIQDFCINHKGYTIDDFRDPQGIGESNILLYLHGNLSNPKSIVLAQSDYEHTYSRDAFKNKLTRLALDKTFLFIGFSFQDPYIKNFLDAVAVDCEVTHYAIMDQTSIDKIDTKELKDKYNIEVMPFDDSRRDFAEQIRAILNKVSGADIRGRKFIGRSKEIKECLEVIKGMRQYKSICFYGYGGGQTELLNAIQTKIRTLRDTVRIIKKPILDKGVSSLSRYISEIFGYDQSAEDTLILQKFVELQTDEICIIIDEFQHADRKFVEDFKKLVKLISDAGKNIHFVVAARQNPFSSTDKIITMEINPLTESQFAEYLQTLKPITDSNFFLWLFENSKKVFDITHGYIKVINYIAANPTTKESIENGSITDLLNADDACKFLARNIVESIEDTKVKEALPLLAILAEYEIELLRDLLLELFESWQDIESSLKATSILHSSANGYKFDDYVGAYIISVMRRTDKANLHLKIAEFYLYKWRKKGRKYSLILAHLIEYSRLSEDVKALSNNFEECFKQLKRTGEYSELRKAIERINDEILNDISVDDREAIKFNKMIRIRYIEVLTAVCAAKRALREIKKIERQRNTSEDDRNALMPYKADCYRLTGRLEECENLWKTAVEKEQDLKVKAALQVGYAHALYLIGKFLQSEEEYNKIDTSLLTPTKLGEYYYRKSKTLRMLGKLDDAISLADKSLQTYEDTYNPSPEALARAHWTKCSCYRLKSQDENSLKKSEKEYELAQKLLTTTGMENNSIDADKKLLDVIKHRVRLFLEHEKAEILRAKKEFGQARRKYDQMRLLMKDEIFEENREALSCLGIAETIRAEIQSKHPNVQTPDALPFYLESRRMFTGMKLLWGELVCDIGIALSKLDFSEATWDDLLNRSKNKFPREEAIVKTVIATKATVIYQINFV